MAKRVAIFPAGRQDLYIRNKYSAAVASGDFLFVSGQVGSREDGTKVDEPEEQLRSAFQNLNAVLSAGGCDFDDIVDFTIYIVDPEKHLDTVFKVKDEYWGEPPYPPITAVGVTWLYGFDFELKATARIPETNA
jgi:enamine deaminase RidA (YjgF/YER057c/UK114 family)